jgi:hypothetical protein
VRAWFGERIEDKQDGQAPSSCRATARTVLIAMLIFNAIPLLSASGAAFLWTLLTAGAIYIPAVLLDTLSSRKP